MAEFATLPSSCELRDSLGRSWAVQVKPAGSDPDEYTFVAGLTSASADLSASGTDSTTLDMGGNTAETKTSRTLTVTLGGNYKVIDGLDDYHPSQKLLKVSGGELGADGAVDLRIWRTDVNEGWESTFNNAWEDAGNDATSLRSFTSTLTPTCAPTRIESVLKGSETEASVPVDMEDYLSVLEPSEVTGG